MRKAIGPKPSPGLYGGKKMKTKKGKKSKGKKRNYTQRVRHAKKKHTRRNKKHYGGSKHGTTVLPQPLVNLGRDMMFNGQSFINSFVGSPAPVNPDPTVQPIIV